MSLHVYANIVTPFGTAANNRAETEGNITTLQKILWMGQPHSTVSAEAIRFALRQRLAELDESGTNRQWNEMSRTNSWQDPEFLGWNSETGKTYIDDDLLGYMRAEAAKVDGPGTARVRRAVLEVTRAVSLTPWTGDVTFNAASPGATPSASRGKNKYKNPVPYGSEVHATRYQFGISLTPGSLREKSRAAKAIEALCHLGSVAGNQGRFLFDFSPEAVVFRLTHDPAPRILYCFESNDYGKSVCVDQLLTRLDTGDIKPEELICGVSDRESALAQQLQNRGIEPVGVKAACNSLTNRMTQALEVEAGT
ncbi:CRISPR-associated protein Cas7/Cst2/DevR [Gimesia panareensis]|uniref:CRISPR-associated protein Cas7/Cst2/DevR n=1 Tax=Gimesia panareensis TaxID=2527978 RepID=A0A517Q7R5_9PLAN|nr:type I-B CRISPR-associated protein Cas7/Cst2/DevR [Gimesia panareensis]QDT27679.1 CRISPR-associated protein Cas7/Cst2/DevR [Gimesia panareensis]